MKIARYLFIFEALLNTVNTLVFLIQPQLLLQGIITDFSQITPLSLELLRWYGVLLFIITYLLWRALFSKNPDFLNLLLEALLIGDVIYIVTQVLLANLAGWAFGSYFGIGISIILMLARSYYLWKIRRS